jgi:hypothetical protein
MSSVELLSPAVRAVLRVCVGLLIVALSLAGAVLAIAGSGAVNLVSWLLGLVLMMGGYVGLGVTRCAWAPLRPMRIALAIAAVIASLLIVALPWPPGRSELSSFITLALGIVLSLSAVIGATRFPRIARAIVGILGCFGILMLARFGHDLTSVAGSAQWVHAQPGGTFALMLAESLPIAWIAACWHARSFWSTLGHVGGVLPNKPLQQTNAPTIVEH